MSPKRSVITEMSGTKPIVSTFIVVVVHVSYMYLSQVSKQRELYTRMLLKLPRFKGVESI